MLIESNEVKPDASDNSDYPMAGTTKAVLFVFWWPGMFLRHVAVVRALLLQVDKSLEARWGQENLMKCKTSVCCTQFLILKIALKNIVFFSMAKSDIML